MTDAIRWDLADSGVLTLTLDRPEVKNAIDTAGQYLLVRRL
jgi:enoyl-CoA hydratase/carnithine racemase